MPLVEDMDNEEIGRRMLEHLICIKSEKEQEITRWYDQLKLKIPACLKDKTIGELESFGIQISDLNLIYTSQSLDELRKIDDHSRKRIEARTRIDEIKRELTNSIIKYYENLSSKFPPEYHNTQLKDLPEIFRIDQ